jgi:4-oxalomesaconate hydratase
MDNQLRILVISAHSFDAFDMAAGTMARYVQAGHEVMLVNLTAGARSHLVVPVSSLEEMKERKNREAARAAEILGIQRFIALNWEDDPMRLEREELLALVNIIREFRPHLLLTHPLAYDDMPDHSRAGWHVYHAMHCAGRPGIESPLPTHKVDAFYCFWGAQYEDAPRMLGAPLALPDIYIDISDVIELKRQVVAQFETQGFGEEFNAWRLQVFEQHLGMKCGVDYAEAFHSIKPLTMDFLPIPKKGRPRR